MPLWSQHLLVLLLVAGCTLLVARQVFQTLRGRKSAIGKCCAKGCDAAHEKAKPTSARTQFMPIEMLQRRR
jgi:hypothetical protein